MKLTNISPPFRIILISGEEEDPVDLIDRTLNLPSLPIGVMLRDRNHDPGKIKVMAGQIREMAIPSHLTVIINSPPDDLEFEEDWWAHFPCGLTTSGRTIRPYGTSAHSRPDLQKYERVGATYAFLSPVYHSSSKPTVQPIGPGTLSEMISDTTIPVFALGGIDSVERVGAVIEAGAWGIAGITLGTAEHSSRLKDILSFVSSIPLPGDRP